MENQKLIHIPFGLDCSVAYNLNKYGLRSIALPFDWMKINKIKTICELLNDNFSSFLDAENWIQENQSDNFNYFADECDEQVENKSLIKLKHKIHNIILPHESNQFEIKLAAVLSKYRRRIDRLLAYLRSSEKKRLYIGVNKITELDKTLLSNALVKIGAINCEIIYIVYSDYPYIGTDDFNWKREYIPWVSYFFTD